MKCFNCGGELPESLRIGDARRGIFKCPHCDASLLRQVVDHTPDGRPVFEFRLWGHPASTRRILRITATTG